MNSRITNYGTIGAQATANITFVNASVISNVQLSQPNSLNSTAITLEDNGLSLIDVSTGSDVVLEGNDCRVMNLSAPHLTLDEFSSGVLLTPLLPEPEEVTDDAAPGAWRTPLRTYLNGWVAADDPGVQALVVHGVQDQSADLTHWQVQDGTSVNALLAIRADGNLAASQSVAIPVNKVDNLVRAMAVYDVDSPTTLLGYIPLYLEIETP